eukprot:m.271782 g.271782  ORF g.271782 m.271782 type:complete len:113 (+) comp26878_c2_seq2:193-531(+)
MKRTNEHGKRRKQKRRAALEAEEDAEWDALKRKAALPGSLSILPFSPSAFGFLILAPCTMHTHTLHPHMCEGPPSCTYLTTPFACACAHAHTATQYQLAASTSCSISAARID